jgi:hypothetical protein
MINKDFTNLISPIRSIKGKVELLDGSTSTSIEFSNVDALKSFKVDRTGELGKFFGFGVAQKLEVKLLDKERVIDIPKDKELKVWLSDDEEFISPYPTFYTTDNSKRDEKTNELTVEAYDKLSAAAGYKVADLALSTPYTLRDFAQSCAAMLGVEAQGLEDASFDTVYENGANFEGTESLRDALDDVAEATQTIYFINFENKLTFKRLGFYNASVLTISSEDYIELTCGSTNILSDITSATELGDNVTATTGAQGVTQYVRDNAFWELRDDIGELVEAAVDTIGGAALTTFNCSWRGNYLLEIGDKIEFFAKNGDTITSYYLNDSSTYSGGFASVTEWKYEETTETPSNPSTLGEALKQTFAKVDKVNKQITLVVNEAETNRETLSKLQVDTNAITASVESIKTATEDAFANVNDNIAELKSKAELAVTDESVNIKISQALTQQNAQQVTTSSGYSFNKDGLTISKSDSSISTTITENGMKVNQNDEEMLVANKDGVKAKDLHATTYLIIGNRSRFEDYGEDRTGCFWIGG